MEQTKSKTDGDGQITREDLKKIFPNFDEMEEADINDLVVGTDTTAIQQKLGVLQRAITAIKQNDEYRQILYLANFRDEKQAMLYAGALALCRKYKSKEAENLFIDRIIAQCGIKSERLKDVLYGMNTYNLRANARTPSWKKKQDKDSIALSP